jgi:hypothetical protein
MFRKPLGMSLAVLALTGRLSAIQLNQYSSSDREVAEDEIENDDGDAYMAQSIAEAEKEVAQKRGSLDMQKEIKQLEEESEVKGSKIAEDADVNTRKNINKMTDQLTADALESKSIFDFNGKDIDVK